MSAADRFSTMTPLQRAYLAVEEMRSKLDSMERARTEPIAIVGMGCRFPGGANNPAELWRVLRDGVDAVTEVPPERWDVDAYYDPDPSKSGKMCTRWGGFVDRVDGFDAEYFGISPREATLMDPQHRLLLEVAAEALEDAGQPAHKLAGSRSGVFVGIYNTDYQQFQNRDNIYAALGNSVGVAAGRLSYTFDLQGPSMLVDTLCSSSLVTVSLACHSLRLQECNLALAGGVNLTLSPLASIISSRLMALAPDGRCKTFDARANGFVRSEGCGVIVLKRLSDAIADGDSIWALIRGTAVNQDGRSTGLTAPNVLAQQSVIRQAVADAGIRPAQVGHIEAHGTGTSLGDPIEIEALRSVYGQLRSDGEPCYITSIKTNFGHAEAAAGIAGLMKSVLALKHQLIPPHLHLRQINPRIDFTGTPFVIPTKPQPWPCGKEKRVAAVSSFGLSGTNAHVILEEAPEPAPESVQATGRPYLLPLSARSSGALHELAGAWRKLLASEPNIHDLCYTASLRRSHHHERLAVVGTTADELRAALETAASNRLTPGQRPKVAFVCAGQGGHYAGMARDLLANAPVFRRSIEATDRAFRAHVDWSLLELLEGDDDRWVAEIDRVQPASFAVQVALAALWRSWGIVPDSVIGHSMGELAAAHIAGILTLEHAAQIVCRRSELLKRVEGHGGLLLADLSAQDAQSAIGDSKSLSIAASNGPRTTLIGGEEKALAALLGTLEKSGVFCRPVKVTTASHTAQIDPLAPDLANAFAGIEAEPGAIPFYSTVNGAIHAGDRCDAAYWVANLRQPVQFWKALQSMAADGYRLFVELSPHPVLAPAIEDGLKSLGIDGAVRASLRRGEPDMTVMLQTLGALYTHGQAVQWAALYPNGGRHVSLPGYPWQRERYWIDASADGWAVRGPRALLSEHRLFSAQPGTHLWDLDLSLESLPYLSDHRVEGAAVVPAAFYFAVAHQAAASVFEDGSLELRDISFRQLLAVPEQGSVSVQLVIARSSPASATFQFASAAGDQWTIYATGAIHAAPAETVHSRIAPAEIRARCGERLPGSAFYRALAGAGLGYGAAFQGIAEIWRGDGEALARIQAPSSIPTRDLHPAMIDACFQVFAGAMAQEQAGDTGAVYLPVGAGSMRQQWRPTSELWVHARLTGSEPLQGDLQLCDENGEVLFETRRFTVQRVEPAKSPGAEIASSFYEIVWRHSPASETGPQDAAGTWLIHGENSRLTARLREAMQNRGGTCVSTWPAAGGALRGMVYVAEDSVDSPKAAQRDSAGLLTFVQRPLQAGLRDAPRLFVITRGAQAVSPADRFGCPAQASLWGMAKTIALEHPEFACTRIDLGAAPGSFEVDQLAAELCSADAEDQIALRSGERHVARLVHWSDRPETLLTPAGDKAFRLEIDEPGILDNLKLRETPRIAPGPGEIEIEVRAAGLNFLDVLSAMGLKPGDGKTIMLGGECAGTIAAVGEGVEGLAAGDAVLCIAPHCFGRFVTTRADFAARKPENLSFEEAATIPVVFLTSWLALIDAGRLQAGERVLIHSGSGGTGLAAIQIAQHAGAEIFATAGNPEKREYLKSLGIRHVMDSRSLAFADETMQITSGQGVDVILNSLAGDAIERGLSILAPYGRFLEIGKRDIYQDRKVGLLPFRNSLSYSAVDLAGLALRRPKALSALLQTLVDRFASGQLRPVPHRTFAIQDAAAAFHTMAQAKHIGKIVITTSAADEVPIESSGKANSGLRPDATYLITGGLGGLGLVVARWLVEQRARHLVLAGRRQPDSATSAKLDELRALGANIVVSQTDISDRAQVAAMLARMDAEMPPLAGVFHAAAVLDDATLTRLTPASVARVFAPKVTGAWNLHELTRDRKLDFFVLFSSAGSVLGSPGQANYTAANAYLDALAHYRRGQGLPALSINWGPWAEVGLAAAQENRGERLAAMGIAGLKPTQALEALHRLMNSDAAQVCVMSFHLRHWRQVLPAAGGLPLYAELMEGLDHEEQAQQESAKFRTELLAADTPARRALLEQHLAEQIAQVLRTSPDRISRDTPFNTLGLDSLMGLELRNRLERSLGAGLPATLVWSHPTIAALAPHLAAKMGAPLEEETSAMAAVASNGSQPQPELDNLSDEDAADLLAEKLAALESEYLS